MAQAQNINSIDVSSKTSQNFFNNVVTTTIASDQNDALMAYFELQTGNTATAQALASAVVYTCLCQGINPMTIVQEFMNLPDGTLNSYLTMFLNLNRVGTSYLGINNNPEVNKYIKRSILL